MCAVCVGDLRTIAVHACERYWGHIFGEAELISKSNFTRLSLLAAGQVQCGYGG